MRYRRKRYNARTLLRAPETGSPQDWNVTRKPDGPSQLYLHDGEDSRLAVALVRRAGLRVRQVQAGDLLGGLPAPVLDTRHRTLIGLHEIMEWLRRVEAVSRNGTKERPHE